MPCSAQYACQRSSISPASAAVYRNGGTSAVVSDSLIVIISFAEVVDGVGLLQGTKKPLTQEGAPCCRLATGQHGRLRSRNDRAMCAWYRVR
ncbi:hypothetical protein KRM28CT15_22360 [Krasilnikovia sp. M28-CT-15]